MKNLFSVPPFNVLAVLEEAQHRSHDITVQQAFMNGASFMCSHRNNVGVAHIIERSQQDYPDSMALQQSFYSGSMYHWSHHPMLTPLGKAWKKMMNLNGIHTLKRTFRMVPVNKGIH